MPASTPPSCWNCCGSRSSDDGERSSIIRGDEDHRPRASLLGRQPATALDLNRYQVVCISTIQPEEHTTLHRPFYNRDDETRRLKLKRFLANASGGLVVLYGRRRCGKSTLLQRVLASEHVYLQADQRETPLQLESLATT